MYIITILNCLLVFFHSFDTILGAFSCAEDIFTFDPATVKKVTGKLPTLRCSMTRLMVEYFDRATRVKTEPKHIKPKGALIKPEGAQEIHPSGCEPSNAAITSAQEFWRHAQFDVQKDDGAVPGCNEPGDEDEDEDEDEESDKDEDEDEDEDDGEDENDDDDELQGEEDTAIYQAFLDGFDQEVDQRDGDRESDSEWEDSKLNQKGKGGRKSDRQPMRGSKESKAGVKSGRLAREDGPSRGVHRKAKRKTKNSSAKAKVPAIGSNEHTDMWPFITVDADEAYIYSTPAARDQATTGQGFDTPLKLSSRLFDDHPAVKLYSPFRVMCMFLPLSFYEARAANVELRRTNRVRDKRTKAVDKDGKRITLSEHVENFQGYGTQDCVRMQGIAQLHVLHPHRRLSDWFREGWMVPGYVQYAAFNSLYHHDVFSFERANAFFADTRRVDLGYKDPGQRQRWFLAHMMEFSRLYAFPGSLLSLDEIMLFSCHHSGLRVVIIGKPDPTGQKLWALACSVTGSVAILVQNVIFVSKCYFYLFCSSCTYAFRVISVVMVIRFRYIIIVSYII